MSGFGDSIIAMSSMSDCLVSPGKFDWNCLPLKYPIDLCFPFQRQFNFYNSYVLAILFDFVLISCRPPSLRILGLF